MSLRRTRPVPAARLIPMRLRFLLVASLCLFPVAAQAQVVFWPVVSNLPALAGARVRAERLSTRRSPNVIVMGLLEHGLPFSGLYAHRQEIVHVAVGGDITYEEQYNVESLPDAFWNGDAIFEDLTGDGRADILMMGDARRDSAATPAPGIVFYREGTSRVRIVPTTLPALYASRFALRGTTMALAGRGASGLTLEVFAVTRAATPTFARLAQLPGLEFPALALGDCDRDGDMDLFAAGANAAGLPQATLYRNDGGTFTPVATLPGLFRGDAAFGDVDGDGDDDLAYTGYRYGPGLAEGNVLAFRMQGCVPTPLPVPAAFQPMMGEFLVLEDVTGDGRVDLVVSGLVEPFRARDARLRIAQGNGAGGLLHLPLGDRFTFALGSGTLLGLPANGVRPSFFGIGIGPSDQPGVWFHSRPGTGD
jgi:hypothetical protein